MNDSQSEVLAVCEVVFREGEEAKIGTLTMFSAFHGTARVPILDVGKCIDWSEYGIHPVRSSHGGGD
jgi:hypothetical protein